ncbi:universal stress protein [Amnibacterium kyonggiense]|uniref:Universal stress protein family protein n=1 Tax=Amnibacterium kyonggiense TaxID=595671 RepID=A0A4R7FKL5_9MICO|nr:universal stress protein [Amnibacterium kyonggiense]TDS76888.1 universal stress protein family protein [Amnibacterium kyonggiense]
MIDDAIVWWDGSSAAAEAAEWAAARQAGRGTLVLLEVEEPGRAAGPTERATARAALDLEVQRLRAEHPGVVVTTRFARGAPAAVLRAAPGPTAVLVLGTRDRADGGSRSRRAFAIHVAVGAAGPVVVLPDHGPDGLGDRVVTGVDGSATAIEAALLAADEAIRRHQPLVVVHAWFETIGGDALMPLTAGAADQLSSAHRVVLDEAVGIVSRRHPALAVTPVLAHLPAGEAIARESADASLVVLGRHSGALPVAALLGSTARVVLRRAAVPTLLMGPAVAVVLAA